MGTQFDGTLAVVRSSLSDPQTRTRLVTPAALGLIGLTLAFRAWAVYRGWFFADDFVFLSDAARGVADPAWLFHRYNVHVMPLGFLLVLPVAHAGPFVWAAAATEIILLQALSSFCCWIMLRTLFGNHPKILIPLTFYLFSAISMPSIMWWAASLNMLTVQPPLFLGIAAHVVFLRTGRKRFAVAAASFLVIALGCYVKAIFFPVVLVVIAVVYFTTGTPLRRVLEALRRWWLAWVMYGLVGAGYLVAYFRLGGSPAQTGSVDLADLTQRQVIASLGSGLLGGPWRWVFADIENGPRKLADPPELVQILCTVLIVLLLIYLAGRYHGAMRPLWFIIPSIAFTVGVLAAGRVSVFGTAISMEIRYWTDSLPFFTLAIGLMCLPLLGSPDPLRIRTDPVIARGLPRAFLVSLAAAYVAGALVSSASYASAWHANYDARAFLHTATADLKAQAAPVELADEAVPQSVMQSLAFPYNLTSRILAPLDQYFRTPKTANDIHVLNGFGQVVSGEATPDLKVPQEKLTTCLQTERDGEPATVHLGSRTFDYPFWASITYRSPVTMDVVLVAGSNRYRAQLLEGLHTLSLRTTGAYDTIDFELPARTRVCLDSIHIGQRIVGR